MYRFGVTPYFQQDAGSSICTLPLSQACPRSFEQEYLRGLRTCCTGGEGDGNGKEGNTNMTFFTLQIINMVMAFWSTIDCTCCNDKLTELLIFG